MSAHEPTSPESHEVIVFLGPSLCPEEARRILPDATYLPPVQCGDVVRALRLRPRIIAIVDGVFERVPAVWHKELLLALRRGVIVLGGGSMGALRAAELAPLGMLGAGRSFEEYLDGTLLDDDEVAIVHTSEGEALCDAMVNIRDTAQAAVAQGVLCQADGDALVRHAKGCFYPERTFEGSAQATLPEPAARAVLSWSRAGGFVDRKRADAGAVLRLAAQLRHGGASGLVAEAPVVTGFLRTLSRRIACSALPRLRPDLPSVEQVACASRFLGPAYEDAGRLALLLSALHDIAQVRDARPATTVPDWMCAASLDAPEAPPQARGRLQLVAGLAVEAGVRDRDADDALLDLMRVDGAYERHRATDGDRAAETIASFARQAPLHHRRLAITARLWCTLDRQCEREQLIPRTRDLQEFADRFRHARGLDDGTTMMRWLQRHDLDEAAFVQLMVALYRLDHLAPTANLDAFRVTPLDTRVFWLHDALWISGLWAPAQFLLRAPTRARCVPPQDDLEAFARDFPDGVAGVPRELAALRAGVMQAV